MARTFSDKVQGYRSRLGSKPIPMVEGRLTRMVGLTLEAVGCKAPVGSRCLISMDDDHSIEAEIVGFCFL